RNWHPLLPDVVARMAEDGIQRAVAFVTSAFGSTSGCRQYLGDIERARAAVGPGAPRIHKLRLFFNHPLFLSAVTDHARAALHELDDPAPEQVHVVFTAHSVPMSMARCSPYEDQLRESARLVAEALGTPHWDLVYQSRSGRPEHPWLEPDVCDHLRALHAAGNQRSILLVPLGFLSDHMEVLYDLDVEAREVAQELGQSLARAAAPGTHPDLVAMIRDLVMEQVAPEGPRAVSGVLPPAPDRCAPDCCVPARPRP
ncbi:MAG TPA: ferrochelatase, partial [Deltaproteobacteria bacterium]|nr:ferrochelatase [Deltaproteobacteria bacterium]